MRQSIEARLRHIERRKGIGKSGFGRTPAVWIVTRSDEDRDSQLAALTAASEYRSGRLVIDWRIVHPDPRMEELEHELRRHRPPTTAH